MGEIKAFAVNEDDENTGGVIFARHAVTARRIGAGEYADGDFAAVRCRRAPWADRFADTGIVPASAMVAAGWWFECSHCARQITEWSLAEHDLTPDDVIGSQNSRVFCSQLCEARQNLEQAEAKHLEQRWIRRFCKVVKRRFPEAMIVASDGRFRGPAATASLRNGKHRLQWVVVPFEFPGMKYGPASLRWDRGKPGSSAPRWECLNGDREAFEAWVKSS